MSIQRAKFTDIKVELIDSMGSDLSVVNAARVSFNKQSEWDVVLDAVDEEFDVESRRISYHYQEVKHLKSTDEKLIKYLADYNHWSPFAHCFLSFRIKAPIFVARQLQKHTVGLAWNEVSRRYVNYEPEFYDMLLWRQKAENKKQGSSDQIIRLEKSHYIGDIDENCDPYVGSCQIALTAYQELLEAGVCEEQARAVLPQSAMTEWIWSGSLYAFARVCNLRTASDAQKETQRVAEGILRVLQSTFPVSTRELVR